MDEMTLAFFRVIKANPWLGGGMALTIYLCIAVVGTYLACRIGEAVFGWMMDRQR